MAAEIRSCKADDVEPLRISFDRDVRLLFRGIREYDHEGWVEHRRRYDAEGRRIAQLLEEHLPGGLFDSLLGAMLSAKASHLHVSHQLKGS